MKLTNLILLTEDDYNQLAETIANRVIQQLQGNTHNVEQPKSDDGFVFQEEAAKLLKVSLRTLIRWDKSGYLPKRHVGRRVAYRREDINRLAGAGHVGSLIVQDLLARQDQCLAHLFASHPVRRAGVSATRH